MQIALAVPDIEVRGNRNLDAKLKFCGKDHGRGQAPSKVGSF